MDKEDVNKALLSAKTVEEILAPALEARGDVDAVDEEINPWLLGDEYPIPAGVMGADMDDMFEELRNTDFFEDMDNSAFMHSTSVEATKLWIEAGIDVNIKDDYGRTALMYATSAEQTKLLIEAGADANAKDNYGKTALDFAETKEQKEILANAMKKCSIQKRKENLRQSQKVRKEFLKMQPDEKISGVALADEIAKDKISGKEKRTITPEVGREITWRKVLEK